MKRNSAIELYRCLLTFGIVILHVIGFYGNEWHWLSSAFVWCVPGFVFISGYFGITFSILRIFRIYGVCAWCFPVSMLVSQLFSLQGERGLYSSYESFLNSWFPHAYIGLIMLVPIVNNIFDKNLLFVDVHNILQSIKKETFLHIISKSLILSVFGPFLIFVFFWSFLSGYNCFSSFIPKAPSCSVLTLLGIYVVARIYRLYNFEQIFTQKIAWGLFVGCLLVTMLKIAKFNSIFSLGITIGSFTLIRNLKLSNCLEKIVIMAGPSMFSIFLIHCNSWCLESMHGYVDYVVSYGIPKPLAFFVVSIIIFTAGLLLDIPRRLVIAIIKSIYYSKYKKQSDET